ncbi:hypothetical protein [Halopenitus sp. POP-27]|uniref:DUF7289 family protein n=1 Tax=Halopenitus sp. POP-27 TaxID=2994425 RepID=UPI002468BB7F|nr:hypothetical protein [Halopenitus sp. POP-27]
MRRGDDRGDSRGASEVLGFILVFSLIVASVGIVFTAGLGGLQDLRDDERVSNAERAVDVLAQNHADVIEGAPSRSTQIRLAGASLRIGDPVTFATETGGTTDTWNATPISVAVGGRAIHLVNGAVIREDPGGSALLRDPAGIASSEAFVVHQTRHRTGSTAAVGGDRTVQVRLERRGQPDAIVREGPTDLTLNVSTTRPGPWHRHYDERGGECETIADAGGAGRDRVSCTFESVETVRTVHHDIAVAFE